MNYDQLQRSYLNVTTWVGEANFTNAYKILKSRVPTYKGRRTTSTVKAALTKYIKDTFEDFIPAQKNVRPEVSDIDEGLARDKTPPESSTVAVYGENSNKWTTPKVQAASLKDRIFDAFSQLTTQYQEHNEIRIY
eukprot:TRINITY_DN3761_c0_g1_i2.p1 TRINITY_DN3761_c0_g1~~TRINITY_DN3761_c0_g1_i2.p1  ORF type:complete len:135 (-),score=4.46 TRINITY_DN3761_c0_g1_i2:125-529(-)